MNRIAVFGGAFDPPHVGHLSIVSALINSALSSEVWFVPTGDIRDKPACAPSAQRTKMLQIFIEENFKSDAAVRLNLCQMEGSSPGSYTIDLMRHLRGLHPDHEFSFVIGSDLLKDLPRWKE